MIYLSNQLARLCGYLSDQLLEAQRRLKRCEDCGCSRYYGRPCKGVE